MFDQLFTAPQAIERYTSSPLLEERLRYLAHCATQGRTRSSLRLIAQHQLVFIDSLHLETAGVVTVEQIHAAADAWGGRDPQPHSHHVVDHRYGRLRFISDATQWLSFLGRLRLPDAPRRAYTPLIEEFRDQMVEAKGLSPHTVRGRCWYVAQFLDRFWEHHRSLAEVSITDIDAAIARKRHQDGYARISIHHYVSALRAFFRYAEQRTWCRPGLAAAIMSPRVFADTSLPKGPSWDDVRRLLTTTEGDQPKNIRDRPILYVVRRLRTAGRRSPRADPGGYRLGAGAALSDSSQTAAPSGIPAGADRRGRPASVSETGAAARLAARSLSDGESARSTAQCRRPL